MHALIKYSTSFSPPRSYSSVHLCQAAATITAAEAVLRELDRFSDPTFDFEAAAKAQQAAATGASGASGASGAAPAKRSIGGGGSGKGKLGKFSAPGWASDTG